ncbi:MAG: hypothetical protein KDA68_23365 [Planctomycetaceae bacterium]|nr:hypothetical protein [Planctomycetaceae bacterium]
MGRRTDARIFCRPSHEGARIETYKKLFLCELWNAGLFEGRGRQPLRESLLAVDLGFEIGEWFVEVLWNGELAPRKSEGPFGGRWKGWHDEGEGSVGIHQGKGHPLFQRLEKLGRQVKCLSVDGVHGVGWVPMALN